MLIIMAGNSRLRKLTGCQERIGLGGEGVLRTEGRRQEALSMLTAAYDAGIRYTIPHQHTQGASGIMDSSGRSTRRERNSRSRQANQHREVQTGHRRTLQELSPAWDVTTWGSGRSMMCGTPPISVKLRDLAVHSVHSKRSGKPDSKGHRGNGHYDPAVLLHAVTHWDVDSVLR